MTVPFLALTRFHLRAGARVAMRALIPAVVVFFAAGSILGPGFIESLSRVLFPAERRLLPAVLTVLFLGAFCHGAGRRLALPSGSWILHLPASGADQRRAALVGVAFSVLPLLLPLVALAAFSAPARFVGLLRVAGLAVAASGAALAALPVRRHLVAGVAGLVGGVLALLQSPVALGIAVVILAVGDRMAGDLRAPDPSKRRRSSLFPSKAAPPRSLAETGVVFAFTRRIAWRSLGLFRLLEVWLWGAIALGMGAVFLANNPIEPVLARGVGRLAVASALVLTLARTVDHLSRRRPVWAFARSLPWSARQRVVADTMLLGLISMPPLVSGTILFPASVIPAALLLPWLLVRASAHLRSREAVGPSGLVLLEGFLLGGLITLLPLLSPLALISSPWFLTLAANADRDRRVVVWRELEHEGDGDPAGVGGASG